MKFLRWFFGFVMVMLLMLVQERKQDDPETIRIIQPQYEQATLEDRNYVYYTIQSGDTLSHLERKFRIPSREAILQLNPDLDPERLTVNQRIKIPLQ